MKKVQQIYQNKRIAILIYALCIAAMQLFGSNFMDIPLNERYLFNVRLDYVFHFLFFLPLAPCWRISFPKHNKWKVLLYTLLIGALSELIQMFLPARVYNIYDLISNIAGVLTGFVIGLFYFRR